MSKSIRINIIHMYTRGFIMSTQAQVNASAHQYVLYYIGVENKDSGVYPTDLSGVCTLAFGEGDTIVCNDWTLGESYPAPSNDKLLKYVSADVLARYNGFYVLPVAISDFQYFKISSVALDSVRTDDMRVGFKVFDTTNNTQRRWDGKSWVSE